ncbi:hypothetical protein ABEY55_26120 [Priestia aryabhattai]|uniref:hypothetical protein n=1 Tax=Priestia aryabhattai TaxID=412384 RepID=UPI003D2CD8B8
MYNKLLNEFVKAVGGEIGEKAVKDSIEGLMNNDERKKTYNFIKNNVIAEPFKYSRQELQDYLFTANFFSSLTTKKAPSNGFSVFIPVYGLYKLWEYNSNSTKWNYICESLDDLIKRRDLNEYEKILQDPNYQSKYFEGFPQLLNKFKNYNDENNFTEMAYLFVDYMDVHNLYRKESDSKKILDEYGKRLKMEENRLKRIKGTS